MIVQRDQLDAFLRIKMLILILSISALGSLNAQQGIDLKDYGVCANSFQDAVPAITQALVDAAKYESNLVLFSKRRI